MINKLKLILLLPQTIFALVITDASVGIVDVDRTTNCLYALFYNNTFRKTCNNGSSWTTIQSSPNIYSASAMKIDSQNHRVYIYGSGDIYTSSLGNIHWNHIVLPTNDYRNSIKTIDIANGKLYYQAGNRLYSKSVSGSWVASDVFPAGSQIESWEVLDNGTIYLGDYNYKVYESSNSGQSWSETNWMTSTHLFPNSSNPKPTCDPTICPDEWMQWETLNGSNQSSPVSLESVSNKLFSGSYVAGVHVYQNASWSQISSAPLPSSVGAFTIALVNTQTIYTQPSYSGFGDIPVHPVYRTVNQGATWEKIDSGMYFQIPKYGDSQNIKVVASNDGTVYAKVNDGSLYSIKYPSQTWRCLINNAKPIVETTEAKNVNNKIELKALAYPNGLQNTVWFEYGESKDLGHTTQPSIVNSQYGSKNITHAVNFESSSGKIYYRIVSSNKNGLSYGKILKHDTFDIASVLSAILSVLNE